MQIASVPFSPLQILIMILAIAAATAITRFLPFWLFPENQKVSPIITYLGHTLPPAMIGLLVVYCLKETNFTAAPHAIPEAIAIGIIVLLHTWKRNVLLSIAGGTAIYMVLIRIL